MFSVKAISSFTHTYDVLLTKPKTIFSNVITQPAENSGSLIIKRWATKKSSGGSKNGRDSNPQYRGVKKFTGETVLPGHIIVRQKGSKFHAGEGVVTGKDFTLSATKPGFVKFREDKFLQRTYVHVYPIEKFMENDEKHFAKLCQKPDERGKIWPQFMNKIALGQN